MKAAQFIQIVKNKALQNVATDFYDNSDWIFSIRNAVDYIFRYMNAKNIWYYSSVSEELAASNPKEYQTTYSIHSIVYDEERKITGIWGDDNPLRRRNFFVDGLQGEDYNYTLMGDENGLNKIITTQEYTTVKSWYKRGPIPLRIGDDLAQTDIDLPEDVLGILQKLVMWDVMPTYLENGAEMSNYYYVSAQEDLDNYKNSIGNSVKMDGFITE